LALRSSRSVDTVDSRKAVHDFLVSRRARLTPERAGLPSYGDKRRVPGLRREEVASLAGVSVDYYARLERGDLAGVSDSVLDALARALQLDEAERQHLDDLARAASPSGAPRPRSRSPKAGTAVPTAVASILAGMSGVPAYVRNARFDILAANDLCRALYGGILDTLPVNLARLLFLDPRARTFYLDWETIADDCVGSLRSEVGRHLHDRGFSDLVGELTTRSDQFAVRWARHNVRLHRSARKRLHNQVVGDIELTGTALELAGDGLIMIAYAADPDSPAQDQLRLLATWQATFPEPAEGPEPVEGTNHPAP
jgi:transcriptional regulator with XRE-family HTH domain